LVLKFANEPAANDVTNFRTTTLVTCVIVLVRPPTETEISEFDYLTFATGLVTFGPCFSSA